MIGNTRQQNSADVCQLRLDFETFVLNDPVTATTGTVGTASPAAAGLANSLGNCFTDQFSVTAPGGKSNDLWVRNIF